MPQTTESITRERIDNTISMANPEDAIQVRNRYIGDTHAPVGMRTSGTSASARNLIYADGILLSSLLGNNNTNTGSARGRAQAGKPQAGTVSPCRISTAKAAKAVMAVCIRSMSRPAVKATKVTEAVPDQGPIPAAAAQKRANDSPGRGTHRLF